MAYAEKVPSPSGDYWRGRYKDPEGRYITVRAGHGDAVRFGTRRDAKKAAEDKEADVRAGRWRDPAAGSITFAEWVQGWYAGLDLAESTMANRKRHLEDHLLPFFGTTALRGIDAALILKWEREERAAGYEPGSIRTWRGTLHICLEDAAGVHIGVNPATRKRGRGKRSGRKAGARRGPEKVIAGPLGVLLIAERMSILSGRDDEFIMTLVAFWEALRLGELAGLEKPYVRARSLRVEWQLHEVEGKMLRCAPKDDSYGDPDMPAFLRALLDGHMHRVPPVACPCHGKAYIFRGLGVPRTEGNMPIRVLASAAGVSQTVAQSALGGKGRTSEATRQHVLAVAEEISYRRDEIPSAPAWHWRRSAFEEMFTAAASGWFPARSPLPARPVPLKGEWPGVRVRGRNAQGRAEFSWLPVAQGMTPHGLRHSAKTLMEEKRIPEILSESHLRHDIPGVSGAYRHVTAAMRGELTAMMTAEHEAALGARLAMSPRSPVAVLDGLLQGLREARKPHLIPRDSPGDASGVLPFPASTPSDLRRGGEI